MPDAPLFAAAARRVMERSQRLAACSDLPTGIARLFCSEAMRGAHAKLSEWMTAAGLGVRVDAAGNLIGRREATHADARSVLVGSHLDTVVDAGRYDGVLGVLLGLALAELCHEQSAELPLALEVIGFSEEEGIRYQTPYIGSRAIAGDLRSGDPLLERLDGQGVRLADALANFGGDPATLSGAAFAPDHVAAFLEPHIEQGPVLEQQDAPLGVVTAVAGQSRACFRFTGEMGHAGTVPMDSRRDPMPAAAAFVCEVERIAKQHPGAMATVGRLEVSPNVANVIPGEVAVRTDVRHGDDSARETCFVAIHRAAMAIAEQRGVGCRLEWLEQQAATQCDAGCVELIAQCVAEEGLTAPRMTSGAGHDAVVMAPRYPTALLFVRCGGGVSHHPDESVTEADVETALRVLWRALHKIAQREPTRSGTPLADPA